MDPNSAENWFVPSSWTEFVTQGKDWMADNVEAIGQPPSSPVPVQLEVGEGSAQALESSSKGNKGPTKPKHCNFSQNEDLLLLSCWINVSTDPVKANGQWKCAFWKRIVEQYNNKRCTDYPQRTLRSLGGRWDFIKDQVSKFAGHHRQIQLEHRSWDAPCDEVAAAIVRYNSLEKKRPFAVAHCWAVLRKEPKWLDLLEVRNGADNTGQGLDDGCQGGAGGDESHDDEASRGTKRPMGRNATKDARKRASSASEAQSVEYMSKMSDMSLQRTSFWRESDERANDRLDKLVEIEAQRLEIERGKEEDRVLAMDLATLHPMQRAVIERKQKAIMARYCREDP